MQFLAPSLLLGIASVFYSLSIAVIPFLAARIVRGRHHRAQSGSICPGA
jgi:hypothetical protein